MVRHQSRTGCLQIARLVSLGSVQIDMQMCNQDCIRVLLLLTTKLESPQLDKMLKENKARIGSVLMIAETCLLHSSKQWQTECINSSSKNQKCHHESDNQQAL